MSATQLDTALATRLEARRTELETDIRAKLAAARELTGSAEIDQIIEGGDYAAADLVAAVDIAEVQRDIAELREIVEALERLDAGQYGWCVDCGDEIGPGRLDVHPAAIRCTRCQVALETRTRIRYAAL
jgi:RNA polymerase-binding transcription factor DksA